MTDKPTTLSVVLANPRTLEDVREWANAAVLIGISPEESTVQTTFSTLTVEASLDSLEPLLS